MPAVCSTAMIAELASDRVMFTAGSLNSSLKFSQWICSGNNVQSGAVISVSIDSALRTIR